MCQAALNLQRSPGTGGGSQLFSHVLHTAKQLLVAAPLSRNPATVLTMGLLLPPPPPLPAAAASGMLLLLLLLLGSCNEKQRKGASCVSHVSHPPPVVSPRRWPQPYCLSKPWGRGFGRWGVR
jgi:hypothetical protein